MSEEGRHETVAECVGATAALLVAMRIGMV